MDTSTIWWVATGVAVAVELATGTFYLLMFALGMAAAALAAHAGLGVPAQLVAAAVVGGGSVAGWYMRRRRLPRGPAVQSDKNVNLDVGESVMVEHWQADGTASVRYRGANWTAIHRPSAAPSTGPHRVAEVVGNRLVVEKL